MGNEVTKPTTVPEPTKEELICVEDEDYLVISRVKDVKSVPKLEKSITKKNEKKAEKILKNKKSTDSKRVVIYYSPEENQDQPISLDTLANDSNIDVIEVCTLHLCKFTDGSYIHLNDYPPDDPMFADVKSQVSDCQKNGQLVLFMLGGWEGTSGNSPSSESTWVNLFNDWNTFYPKLKDLITDWGVDGLDLDCENSNEWGGGQTNYNNITKLIEQLKYDFGDEFKIVLAPVAQAVYTYSPNGGLSGFNYKTLMDTTGKDIAWLNCQFYNGWGTLNSPNEYEAAVNNEGFNPSQLVAGMEYTYSADFSVNNTIETLATKYGDSFGGVFVWVGNTPDVQAWAKTMKSDMNDSEKKEKKKEISSRKYNSKN